MKLPVVLLVVVCAMSQSCFGATEVLTRALERLGSIESVEGAAVGFGATTGDFYAVAKIISTEGNIELFTKLSTSSSPISRCMGLYCMALVAKDRGLPTIKAALSDAAPIQYCPYGCIVTDSTVGGFAYQLLLNRDPLSVAEPTPLVNLLDLASLSAKALADDSFYHLHGDCREVLRTHLLSSDRNLSLSSLSKWIPDIHRGKLIKAIGRLGPDDLFKNILLECAQESECDVLTKMTAWSALTRYTSKDVDEAVQKNLSKIDLLESGFGETIQSQLKITQRHEAEMDPIYKERTWMGMEAIEDKLILAYSLANPVAVPDLSRSFGLVVIRKPAVRETVVSTLLAISRDQAKYVHTWSTYSYLPEQLRAIVRDQRSSDHRVIDERSCKAIEANL